MAELLQVPLKKPSEIDVVKPLQNVIQSRFSTADEPVDYSDAINEFAKIRSNAIWKAFEKYESSLDVIYGYDSCTLIIIIVNLILLDYCLIQSANNDFNHFQFSFYLRKKLT